MANRSLTPHLSHLFLSPAHGHLLYRLKSPLIITFSCLSACLWVFFPHQKWNGNLSFSSFLMQLVSCSFCVFMIQLLHLRNTTLLFSPPETGRALPTWSRSTQKFISCSKYPPTSLAFIENSPPLMIHNVFQRPGLTHYYPRNSWSPVPWFFYLVGSHYRTRFASFPPVSFCV